MYTLRVYDIENKISYEEDIESLGDYHSTNLVTYDNVPDFDNKGLVDCLDLSFAVLLSYNDGEDFYYQYINKPIFSGSLKSNIPIGTSYKSLFNHLNNIDIFSFAQRSWKENKRVDINVEIYQDSILKFGLKVYYIRNNQHLYAVSKSVDEFVSRLKNEEKLINDSEMGIVYVNKEGKIVLSNDIIFQMLNISKEDVLKKDVLMEVINNFYIFNEDDLISSNDFIKKLRAVSNHEISNLTLEARTKNIKKEDYFKISIIPLIQRREDVIRISMEKITKTKLQETQALRLNKILNTMQELATVALGYYDYNSQSIEWSDEIYNILEVDSKDLDVTNLSNIYPYILPEDFHIQQESVRKLSPENPDEDFVVRLKTNNNKIKYIHQYYKSFYNDLGEKNLLAVFAQDITKTRIELNQKDMLVKEVHHRVKNNLQIILSLLNLDLKFNNDNLMVVIEDTKARLSYMTSLHEKIYKSSEFQKVDLKNYFPDIVENLLHMYESNIKFHSDLESEVVDLDTAIPLGLILTEIINNATKYAFPEKEGNFYIKYNNIDNESGVVDFWDDGVGFPKDFDYENTDSLGLTVIKSLTSQINGEFIIVPDNGAHYQVSFPIK